MAVTTDQPAPYAPASAILDLIERHRNRGLPPVVDIEVLLRAGVSDSLAPRTMQALKTLDLLTDDGRPSEVLEGIRLAPTAEYQQRLAEWLKTAYADALTYVDPATDDEVAIRDAFRQYTPTGQQGRMVTLFMGLFTAAGVMPSRARQPGKKDPASAPKSKPKFSASTSNGRARPTSATTVRVNTDKGVSSGALPPAISGLLTSLPSDGDGWTQERRDRFLATFGAVIDFCFPIVADEMKKPKDEYDELLD